MSKPRKVKTTLDYLTEETVSLSVSFTPAEVASMIMGLSAAIQNADNIVMVYGDDDENPVGFTEQGIDMMIHAVERLAFAADRYLDEIGFDPDQEVFDFEDEDGADSE